MRVVVEKVRNRIHLTSPYRPDIPDRCKRIPGHKWLEKSKAWSYPLSMDTCRALRREFGESLVIGGQLEQWAWQERRRVRHLLKLYKMKDVQLKRVPDELPRLWEATAKRPLQRIGIAVGAASRRMAFADDPGGGKSGQVIGACIEAGVEGPIALFSGARAIKLTWEKELAKWAPDEEVWPIVGDRKRRERLLEEALSLPRARRWLLMNPEMARATQLPYRRPRGQQMCPYQVKDRWYAYPGLFEIEWGGHIVDEFRRYLITHSSRFSDQSMHRAGLGILPVAERGVKFCLDGTPWKGKPQNAWGTFNWLRPDLYTSFWDWIQEWFEIIEGDYAREIGPVLPEKRKRFYRGPAVLMLRRTKKELAPEMPPKLYCGWPLNPDKPDDNVAIWLDLLPQQRRLYKEMEEEAAVMLDDGSTVFGLGILAMRSRLKFLATACARTETVMKGGIEQDVMFPALPSNKFNYIVDWLDRRGIGPEDAKDGIDESSPKVVIATESTKVIRCFREALADLGVPSLEISGRLSNKETDRAGAIFQTRGGPRVMFINKKAGGSSLDLDAYCSDLIMIDEDDDPDEDTQVSDRIHRLSRIHQVHIWRLRSIGTVDDQSAMTQQERHNMQGYLLDGSRGIDFARRALHLPRPKKRKKR